MSYIAEQNNQAAVSEPHNDPVTLHLKWFNGTKGFGFVVPEDQSFDAFLHVTTLQEAGIHSIGEGAVLLCTVFDGEKGKQVKEILEVIDRGTTPTTPEQHEDGSVTMGGLVKWFKEDKGFGFIIPDDGMKDVFVHQTCLERSEIESLKDGQRVLVTLKDVDKGREAIKISLIDPSKQ